MALRRSIAGDNASAAAAVAMRIRIAVEHLAAMPQTGRTGRVKGTRELVVAGTPYIVVHTAAKGGAVEILAVLHGARQWPDRF